MALIKCAGCGAEISDKAMCCPKCGVPVEKKSNTTIGQDFSIGIKESQIHQKQEPDFVRKQKKKSEWLWGFIAALLIVMGALYVVLPKIDGVEKDSGPKYYVAQIPSEIGNASFEWTGVIDGYIHKDKECCQSVVNYWNSLEDGGGELKAEVVKIDPDSTAYKNRMGQAVSYEVALGYCPLCRGW